MSHLSIPPDLNPYQSRLVVKCLKMKWKRIRKGVGGAPDPEVYENKKQILKALKKLFDQGFLDLRYKG